MMRMIGVTGMREALRLGVTSYSHASDLKDAGISSPTAEVAGYVIQGAIEAYRTQMYLKKQNASDALTVTKISLLTGPAYFEDSKEGIKKVISTKSNYEQTRYRTASHHSFSIRCTEKSRFLCRYFRPAHGKKNHQL